MAESNATTGYGCTLARGDGGVGAGTQASRTVSTSNQQIIIRAKNAGTAGNSKTCSILVSGNNTAFALSVTEGNITITSATDGSAVATTTVNEALYQLMQDDTFAEHWEATRGAGNGTGILVAAASAALTGGTNGAEVFTDIGEIKGFTGPAMRTGQTEVTHMLSPDGVREFRATLHDPGEVSFQVNLVPSDTQQQGLRADQFARTLRNFRITLSDADSETIDLTGFVTAFDVSAGIEDALTASVSIKVTSKPVWSSDA